MSKVLHGLAAIVCNVGGFLIFITAFFFTAGTAIEERTLENQLDFIVRDSVSSELWLSVPQEQRVMILGTIGNTTLPDMSAADASTRKSNRRLRTKSFVLMFPLGIGLILLALLIEGLRTKRWRALWVLLGMMGLMMVGVAVVEVTVAFMVSSLYLTTSPHFIAGEVVKEILKARDIPVPAM
jgi:hypothetical protein